MPRDLHPLFNPRSIAIVGASPDPRKVRGMAVASLIRSGFPGAIHPINPSHAEVQGLKAHARLADVPEPVDLALLVVGDAQVLPTLEECADAGVRSAVVLAGVPTGEEGRAIDRAIGEFARRTGVTVLGPNCLGLWNMGANVVATFAPLVEDAAAAAAADAGPRTLSIVSHSGGIGQSLYDKAHRAAIGVRYVVTTGNEADLEMLEVVDWLVAEGGSRTILLYLEGFRRPATFSAVAERARAAGVRLVVVKAGRSAAGARAAVSHTAHLTGAEAAYDAMFARHGVRRVDDLDQAIAVAKGLSGGRAMAGRNALILSTGGGFGALLADACEGRGIAIPELDEELRATLAAMIPAYGNAANPVDLPGGNVLEDNGVSLARIIDAVEASPAFNAIVLCFGLDAPGRIERMRAVIEPALRRAGKPVLFHSPTLVAPDNWRALAEMGVQQYSVGECAAALDALAWFDARHRWPRADHEDALPTIAPLGEGWGVEQAAEELARGGIPLPSQRLVHSADEAASAAAAIGFPVALKIADAAIAHKSDVGGVALALSDEAAVRDAFPAIVAAVMRARPDAATDAMIVQRMAAPGREFAIGVTRDADFGLLLMLSAGGVLIEVLRDTVHAPLPVDRAQAHEMVSQLRGAVLLTPLRGRPAGDRDALERLIVDTARLALALGDALDEIEFNPVIVHEAGAGVSVVDTLIVPRRR